MNLERVPQADFWGYLYYPQPRFDTSGVSVLLNACGQELFLTYEDTGFVEFETFTETNEGLLGFDLDAESKPNLKLIFVKNPWSDPSADIYYLEGNFSEPFQVYRYRSQRRTPRRKKDIEDIFFHLMYPKKKRSRLQELAEDEVVALRSVFPFSLFLTFVMK